METAAIILAAGAGTRMKSPHAKVAHTIMDKALVRWVIDVAKEAQTSRIITVVGFNREEVIPLVDADTQYVVQEQQLGTANAVAVCKDALADFDGSVYVLNGDSPLITAETLQKLSAVREKEDAAVVVLTMKLENPFGYGRIIRNAQGEVERIVEQKDATPQEAEVNECNSGFYCFDARALFDALSQVDSNNAQGEFYLTDVLEISRAAGRKVCALVVDDPTECLGVNTPEQLEEAAQILKARIGC